METQHTRGGCYCAGAYAEQEHSSAVALPPWPWRIRLSPDQGLSKLIGCFKAIGGHLGERLLYSGLDLSGDSSANCVQRRHRIDCMSSQDGLRGGASEWWLAGQHFIRNA